MGGIAGALAGRDSILPQVVPDLTIEKQKLLEGLHGSEDALAGKKTLVVDDDVRNIFALSSLLERRG